MADNSNPETFRSWFRPTLSWPKGARPAIPGSRAWKIGLRTVHLIAAGMLLGGHTYGAAADALRPWLYVAIVTGAGMALFEAYPSLHFICEGWGLFLLVKLALLCVIPFAWEARVPILIVVIVLASVGSHMPARFRHYSIIYGKIVKD